MPSRFSVRALKAVRPWSIARRRGFILMTMLTLTTGTAFIMWLGEQISDRGIGNGMSFIFAGIVVGLPRGIRDLWEKQTTQQWGSFTPPALILLVVVMVAVLAFIVLVEGSQRRIPVQYARRIVGWRIMGDQMSYLPLRVNSGGVIHRSSPARYRLQCNRAGRQHA